MPDGDGVSRVKGLVNLSTLSLVWKYITPELLDRIGGMSKREVEAIVAEFNPGLYAKDRIKPVVVERLVIQPESTEKPQTDKECKNIYRRRGGKLFASVGDSTPQQKEKFVRRKVKMHDVRCLVDDDVMRQLERCKELLSSKFPQGLDYSGLLRELAGNWLERHDPLKREERRAMKKRRNSTWDLELHHDGTAFGRGGGHGAENLRLLCREHNQLEAEKEYGEQAVKKHYIKEAPVAYTTGARKSNLIAPRLIC